MGRNSRKQNMKKISISDRKLGPLPLTPLLGATPKYETAPISLSFQFSLISNKSKKSPRREKERKCNNSSSNNNNSNNTRMEQRPVAISA